MGDPGYVEVLREDVGGAVRPGLWRAGGRGGVGGVCRQYDVIRLDRSGQTFRLIKIGSECAHVSEILVSFVQPRPSQYALYLPGQANFKLNLAGPVAFPSGD